MKCQDPIFFEKLKKKHLKITSAATVIGTLGNNNSSTVNIASRKHAYIILTPLNPTFI